LINENGGEVKNFIELDLKEFGNGSPGISTPQQIEKAVYDAVSLKPLYYLRILMPALVTYVT